MTKFDRREFGLVAAVAVLATMIIVGAVTAEEYVSWRGSFHITLPEHFDQLDYGMVDGYLRANRADRSVLDYEAVFADTNNLSFPHGEYFLIALEKIIEPSESQIDSVLALVFQSFGMRIRYAPVTDFVTNLSSNKPNYSRDEKIASVITAVAQPDGTSKRNLMMIKFYEEGIVSLFYYAPDSLFDSGVEKMRGVIESLSTEDLDSAATRDKPKITSARPMEKPDRASEDGNSIPVAVYVGVGVVFIVIIARRRKKSKK